ncbi:G-type lectin S-receptor-like serine/threonine-protein kinase SD2-5 [Nymphaea colorata]|nr:G-type lectin S-receptor-like serine/threonine-protein kinase SD2-5 [Nymphaea colorata]
MLMSKLAIFLLACYCNCYCQFLLASAQSSPAFLAFNGSFKWDVTGEREILKSESTNPVFACGFIEDGTSYNFSISIYADEPSTARVVVWTANTDKPLDDNSALKLAQDGNLELVYGNGSVAWSTRTSGKPVTAMKLEETGNLVLLDAENRTLWQSFDHPTDTLVAGQRLQEGQRLTSFSNSPKASYFVLAKDGDLRAFIDGKPPQMYLQLKDFRKLVRECRNYTTSRYNSYAKLLNVTRENCNKTTPQFLIIASVYGNTTQPPLIRSPNHFLKLESDGRLVVYDWNADGSGWMLQEFGNNDSNPCLYPLRCGRFGVCNNGDCSCPTTSKGEDNYFKHSNPQLPHMGCEEIGSVPSCKEPNNWSLVDFGNYSYFGYVDSNAAAGDIISLDACRKACLYNCSCKAAFFNYQNDNSTSKCYLLGEVFSIRAETLEGGTYISRAFFKVSNWSVPQDHRKQDDPKDALSIIGIAMGSSAVAVFVVGTIVFLVMRKREEEDEGEDELDQVSGMVPRRFSYEELKTATGDFQTILGQGGFGSVFEGVLNDGTRIAVKRLDNIGQGMKEFVAEVQTIGSIHHMNLVRLVGFCARKSHRLLVYEYMSNGSLDKWIFHENGNPSLDWKTRQSIIIGTSKGLCYLHEECSHRIAHLDVKPQNILLDENYSAKLSDFGLSKLISRDQSQVVTTMRGTPGYLAPEWLSASISEKADVYSFGVVVMEVVCGRRNLDLSQPEGSRHLLKLLYLAQENQLLDLVDMTDEERSRDGEEAVRVMRIAMWCLQNDDTRRPPMSQVVKALEGTIELDGHIELDPFYAMERRSSSQTQSGSETQSDTQFLLLSGPR